MEYIALLDDESRVSHDANVNKLFELVRNNGNSEAIRMLWRATFKGRRSDLESGKLNSTDDMLKTGCPVLNQSTYVSTFVLKYFKLFFKVHLCYACSFKEKWNSFTAREFAKHFLIIGIWKFPA